MPKRFINELGLFQLANRPPIFCPVLVLANQLSIKPDKVPAVLMDQFMGNFHQVSIKVKENGVVSVEGVDGQQIAASKSVLHRHHRELLGGADEHR